MFTLSFDFISLCGLFNIIVLLTIMFTILLQLYAHFTCGKFVDDVRLDGKTVIVTGATGGIGFETAKDLAKRGAKVILACRNLESAKAAKDNIVQCTKNENIIARKLDLSSQKSIRQFSAEILRTEPRLDVLIHNAATAVLKFERTEDEIEVTTATNHVGPFLLTHLLIDLLKKSGPSRIVVVASSFYRIASLNLTKINPNSKLFPPFYYFVTKYANISFTFELARRLKGSNVTVNCLHPGLIDTGIWKCTPVPWKWGLRLLGNMFFKTLEQGCQTTLYLACSREVEGVSGKYFSDCKESSVTSGASDVDKAKKLWEVTRKLANLKQNDPQI